MPSLRRFKLLQYDDLILRGKVISAHPGLAEDFATPLLSLAPQLENLAIYDGDGQASVNQLAVGDWRSFVQLRRLTIGRDNEVLSD